MLKICHTFNISHMVKGANLPAEAYKEGLVGCKLSSFDDFLGEL